MEEFFKDKLNVVLIVLAVMAFSCTIVARWVMFFTPISLFLFGGVVLVIGIKTHKRHNVVKQHNLDTTNMTNFEIIKAEKSKKWTLISYRFQFIALYLVAVGIIIMSLKSIFTTL